MLPASRLGPGSSGMMLSWPAARKISTSSAVSPRRRAGGAKSAQHLIDFAGKCFEIRRFACHIRHPYLLPFLKIPASQSYGQGV